MPLVTVFFPGEGDVEYRKAIVDADHVEYFYGLGATETPQSAPVEKPKAKPAKKKKSKRIVSDGSSVPEPDKGWGKPGTMRWHNSYVQSCTNVDDLYKYVKDITGEEMYRRGSILNLQRNAMKRIKAYFNKHPEKLVK